VFDIDQNILPFEEEMVVIARIGIEIGLGPIDSHFAQKARFRELMERVVDGRQRYRDARLGGFFKEHFRRQMPIALGEKQPAEADALPGGPQPGLPQAAAEIMHGATRHL
jgi:hypothetical protein